MSGGEVLKTFFGEIAMLVRMIETWTTNISHRISLRLGENRLDHKLKEKLDQHDWEQLVEKLTLAALRQLKRCGWHAERNGMTMNPSANDAAGYAVDAMVKAYDACSTGTNKWDPEKGDLYPFLERLVCRLVTDDKREYTRRKPPIYLDDLPTAPIQLQLAQILLGEVFDRADAELQDFILKVIENTSAGDGVRWGDIHGLPGISKHKTNKFRRQLEELLLQCGAEPLPT